MNAVAPKPADRLRARLAKTLMSRLFRDSGYMGLSQILRVVLQAVFFVLCARALGVAGFGAFAGALAIIALVSPFASAGTVTLVLRGVLADRESAAERLSRAITVCVLLAVALAALVASMLPVIAPPVVTVWVVVGLTFADLIGARVVELCGSVYAGLGQMSRTAMLPVVLHAARLVASLWLFVSGARDLQAWCWGYMGSSLLAAALALVITGRAIGWARPEVSAFRNEWREGALYAVGLSSQNVYNDIDKVMLARLATLSEAGAYAAAYRLVDMAFAPVRAVLSAAYPEFFRRGAQGLSSGVAFARRLAKVGVAYGLAALFMGNLLSGLIPLVLGAEYADAVGSFRWLIVLPLLKVLHYLASDALTGAGMQGIRSTIQLAIAVVNVSLNLVLIPTHGVSGAVIASVSCDALLVVLLWSVVRVKLRASGGQESEHGANTDTGARVA